MGIRLAVVGSRYLKCRSLVWRLLTQIHGKYTIDIIISGGAKGIDRYAEAWATMNDIDTKIYLPEYDLYGKAAPLVRNKLIINDSTHLIAFWDGESRGTYHAIDLAKKNKLPINIYIKRKE